MADSNKDEILSILKKSTDHKEETDRALVRIESRLEDRMIEVKLISKATLRKSEQTFCKSKQTLKKTTNRSKQTLKKTSEKLKQI